MQFYGIEKKNWQNRQYRRYRCCRHHRRNHHHHITENAIWNELKTTKSVKMMWFVNVYCAPRTNLRHFNLNACVCNTHFFFHIFDFHSFSLRQNRLISDRFVMNTKKNRMNGRKKPSICTIELVDPTYDIDSMRVTLNYKVWLLNLRVIVTSGIS